MPRVLIPQQQISNATLAGRHLSLMRDVRAALPPTTGPPRILSFGCSTGLECLDLAGAIPDAAIFGCDLDPAILNQAHETCGDLATILPSDHELLACHGPFDAILALNVLCRHPATAGLDDIAAIYPFGLYDQVLATLDTLLAPGGLLALYNGQYFFEDSSIAPRYDAVADIDRPFAGWIEKSLPSGRRATRVVYQYGDIRYSRLEWGAFLKRDGHRARLYGELDSIRYHHDWIDAADRIGRSTNLPIWRKRAAAAG